MSVLIEGRHDICHAIAQPCGGRIYAGNELTLLRNAAEIIPSITEALRAARTSIHVQLYTVRPGELATRVMHELMVAADRGVTVSVIVDAVGSRSFPRRDASELTRLGVSVCFYNPVSSVRLSGIWQRNHRKLVVVDGCVGFIGGISLDDVFLGRASGVEWREIMIRVSGPLVSEMHQLVIDDRQRVAGTRERRATPCAATPSLAADGQLVLSAPEACRAETLFTIAIRRARKTVFIATPYFVPSSGITEALVHAAREGVDVRILVPGKYHTVPIVRYASRAIFGELLRNGVRIFEYQASMVHAKTAVIDGAWATVGSMNLDMLSLRINREANIATCGAPICTELQDVFLTDLENAEEISWYAWRKRSLLQRTVEAMTWPIRGRL